jgi:hypothetical protein
MAPDEDKPYFTSAQLREGQRRMSRVYGMGYDRVPLTLQLDKDQVSTAFHESGHVILAVLNGRRPLRVTLAADGSGLTHTQTPSTTRLSAAQAAAGHLGGWAAEALGGFRPDITSDRYA